MAKIHKHLLVDATLNNPPTDPRVVEDWLTRLVKAVDMEIFMPAQAKYCEDPTNAGVTGIVVLTTSHASIHVFEDAVPHTAKLDLYSCSDYTVEDFLAMLKEFDPIKISYTLVDRGQEVHQIIDSGVIEY